MIHVIFSPSNKKQFVIRIIPRSRAGIAVWDKRTARSGIFVHSTEMRLGLPDYPAVVPVPYVRKLGIAHGDNA
ncbi:MAG: hypothetical protein J6252_05020, partial [Clostridia bacterium]|nr:hypothetical protein [Clostridia bacterium]